MTDAEILAMVAALEMQATILESIQALSPEWTAYGNGKAEGLRIAARLLECELEAGMTEDEVPEFLAGVMAERELQGL